MANSEDEQIVAHMSCRGRNFKILRNEQISSRFSYQIRSSQKSSIHSLLPETDGPCVLEPQAFDTNLYTWLQRYNVFLPSLYFVPTSKPQAQRAHPPPNERASVYVHPNSPQPNMLTVDRYHYSQIAQLNPVAYKILAGMFKAIKLIHGRGEFHHGDLSIPNSYGLKIGYKVNTHIGGNLINEIDVILLPGCYSNTSDFNQRQEATLSTLKEQQRLDISQMVEFIFHIFLKLPNCTYFNNYEKNLTEPRLHSCFHNLRGSLLPFSNGSKDCDFDFRLSFGFYNHYSTLDFAARMRHLSQLYDSHSFPKDKEFITWKDELQVCPEFYSFYQGNDQEAHYGRRRRDLLRFIQHLFAHAKQRFPIHGLCNPEYLEFVLAQVFHKWYGCFFESVSPP